MNVLFLVLSAQSQFDQCTPRHRYFFRHSGNSASCRDCPAGKFRELNGDHYSCPLVFSCPEGKYVRHKSYNENDPNAKVEWDNADAISADDKNWNLECALCPPYTFMPKVSYKDGYLIQVSNVLWNSRIAMLSNEYQKTNHEWKNDLFSFPAQTDYSSFPGIPFMYMQRQYSGQQYACFNCHIDSFTDQWGSTSSTDCKVCPDGKFSIDKYPDDISNDNDPLVASMGPRCVICPYHNMPNSAGFDQTTYRIKPGYYYKTIAK